MLSPTPTSSISKRSLARPRPSLSTAIQPPTSPVPPLPVTSPLLSPASMLARKASFQQLTQNSLASVPDGSAEYGLQSPRSNRNENGGKKPRSVVSTEIEIGDIVDTPAGMHGVVRFIGNVRGKAGVFCGVELEGPLAGKGKNDGVVDGVRYFSTNTQLSGIFVPLSRATKRFSTSSSNTPPTPPPQSGYAASSNFHAPGRRGNERPESPGGRSLAGLARTPVKGSASRPESPSRRTPQPGRSGLVPPTTPRHVSAANGSRLLAPSPTPGRYAGPGGERGRTASVSVGYNEPENRPSTSGGPPRIAAVPKSMGAHLAVKKPNSSFAARSASAMERRVPDEELISPVSSVAPSHGGEEDDRNEQLAILQKKLAEREQQLDEQANTLIEMESTLSELQSLIGNAAQHANSPQQQQIQRSRNEIEDADASQLRALLREKNEKIQNLSAEFDSHRADFRSTIDTLEMASTETVRVYEERMNQLLTENRELQERGEDVESVARQLKQLEELVAELEEGLEDARRGEAEARGEVEFLRGEVERCKEELRREKEKSAAAVANAVVGNMLRNNIGEELEKKDEEIRGLKAIIHSLSRDTVSDDEPGELPTNSVSAGRPNLERSHSVPSGKRGAANDRPVVIENTEELEKERELRQELEKRIAELEAQVKNKTEREEQLERTIELMERDRRSSIISEAAPKTNSIYSVASEMALGELNRPARSASTVTAATDVHSSSRDTSSANGRDSRGGWRSSRLSVGGHNENQPGALTPTAEDSDADADGSERLWCEICEAPGHDILTCTSMFGSSTKSIVSEAPSPSGVKLNSGTTSTTSATVSIPSTVGLTTNHATGGDDDGSASSSEDNREDDIAPLSFKASSPTVSRKEEIYDDANDTIHDVDVNDDDDDDEIEVFSPTTGRRRSVHLPTPPPMVFGGSTAVAGKSSKVVDEGKWCALCERDGHDSVDCPFEDDDDGSY
ncbi:hypothetical protein DFH27DRAFT_257867 [Peziza echinospora]|nr:hypothetical protein DFH27DRAFT_257867 [Peziza echinospora]